MIQIYDTDNSIAGSRHRAKALCKSWDAEAPEADA